MPLAYHTVFCAYGFWLPNDPRGSWSDFVASWELLRFGKPTRPDTAQSLAHIPHDRRLREAAKRALKHPPVHFSGRQALAVGEGFHQAIGEGSYRLFACSVLPEHVHLVVGAHARKITRIIGHLKTRATQRLAEARLWPDEERPVWAENCWKVFLDDEDDVARAVAYVEDNPVKEDKPRQTWSFVMPCH